MKQYQQLQLSEAQM